MSEEQSIAESVNIKHTRAARIRHILLVPAAIIAFAFAYETVAPGSIASAGFFPSLSLSESAEKAAAKEAVLDWMAENSVMPEHVLAKIYAAAEKTGKRDLILAICLVESNFNPDAKSTKGAMGLMGIMPHIWIEELKEQGIINDKDDLYRISENIAAGVHVLETYLSETNDLRKALTRYVGGASWYATRVFRAQKAIELAQISGRQFAAAEIRN